MTGGQILIMQLRLYYANINCVRLSELHSRTEALVMTLFCIILLRDKSDIVSPHVNFCSQFKSIVMLLASRIAPFC